MKTNIPERSPELIPTSSSATAAFATVAFGADAAAGGDTGSVAWAIAAALFVAAAVLWYLLRRADATATAASVNGATLHQALDKAQLKIQNFSDSQVRFVGNLALEIKAPLAAVLIHADLLLASSNEPATVQRYARSVAEDMRHLSDLVESFLRLARPFEQEDISNHVPVAFHDVVLEAVRRCKSLAAARGVSVVPMLASNDVSVEVLGDAVLLEAMIENLVRNALLSAPEGTRVDLHVKMQGEEVLLSVRDHGTQVADESLDAVFDGFFQVSVPSRPLAGTGLSLAVAKRVAEHHRGRISLRNVPGGGCEFEVQLPRWRPEGLAKARTIVRSA